MNFSHYFKTADNEDKWNFNSAVVIERVEDKVCQKSKLKLNDHILINDCYNSDICRALCKLELSCELGRWYHPHLTDLEYSPCWTWTCSFPQSLFAFFHLTGLISDLMKAGIVVKAGLCSPLHDLLKKWGHSLWCSLSKIHQGLVKDTSWSRTWCLQEDLNGFWILVSKKHQTFFPMFTWNSALSLCVSQCWRDGHLTKKTAVAAVF